MGSMQQEGQDWTDIAAKAQTKLINSIPSEWRIPHDKLPPEDQLDVTGFPAKCGLLTDAELKITESLATDIVSKWFIRYFFDMYRLARCTLCLASAPQLPD